MLAVLELLRQRRQEALEAEKLTRDRKNIAGFNWKRLSLLAGKSFSSEKISKSELPPDDIREWKYHDWLGLGKSKVLNFKVERTLEGYLRGEISDSTSYFSVVLKGPEDLKPDIRRGPVRQNGFKINDVIPLDPLSFANNFTRIILIYSDRLARTTSSLQTQQV